ncbi:MAG: hypothetical protein WCR36_07410, partial [Bacteroidaceae bacterium]
HSYGNSNYGVTYTYIITPVEGTDDQINFAYVSSGQYQASFPGFLTHFANPIIEASPYTVVTDSPLFHTQYTFTSVSNPDIWFTVFK